MKTDDIIKIIDSINYDLFELNGEQIDFDLSLEYSYCHIIKFLGVVIWDEDNEEREWIEEKNDYEDLEQFLRTKIKLLIHKISSLKI